MEEIQLTPEQEKAVKYTESPLLIVAGPGTGKTRVLTEKVVFLVKEKGFDPNSIIVSTFTIKAAEELKERLRKKLGDKVESMQISTIHSFCEKMLQTFPDHHNFGNVFDVLDDLDQYMFVNKNIWNYGLKEYYQEIDVDELINFYNKATENDVDPQQLIDFTKKNHESEKDLAIARSYALYLANLLDPNNTKLDFALLQREFYHMLKNNPEVLKIVRDMYDYILIDEYQDTNPIQDAIFKLISEPKFNITVVGDEDQSIYGFRGASVENFRSFLNRYPSAKKLELEENFRSSKEIVHAFNTFIKPHRTFEKEIFTNNKEFSNPLLLMSKNLEDEGKSVVELIKKLVSEHNVAYEDIAILFKSVKWNSGYIQDALEKARIPFTAIGDSSLMNQEAVIDMLILLGYVGMEEADKYYEKLLQRRNIIFSDLLGLAQDTRDVLIDKVDLMDPFKIIDMTKLKKLKICDDDIEILVGLKNLKKQQKEKKSSLLKLFYKILDVTGYHARLFKNMDAYAEMEIGNLAKLSNVLEKFERITNSNEFKTLLYHLNTIPENKMEDATSIEEEDAVKLMTIHQAKGLEFPVVVMAGVTSRRYNRTIENDSYIIPIPRELMLDKTEFSRSEELQRTFYVGMSRAQQLLVVSTVDGKGSKPSPYIDEIGTDNFVAPNDFSSNLEKHYVPIKEKVRLSYSSVSAYIECPFRFYLRDLLSFQTPIAFYQEYGIIVHNCLKKIHILMKEGKKVQLQDIIQVVDTYCKNDESRQKWRDELITDMWNYYERAPTFIKEVLDVELPFSYISKELVINGQADLVIETPDNDVELIDYKSRYEDALRKMNVDTQLRMYFMALFQKYPNGIKKISAYTFKDNKKTYFSCSDEDINCTKTLLTSISNDIEQKKFSRNWKGSICVTKTGKCDFYGLCYKLEEENDESRKTHTTAK